MKEIKQAISHLTGTAIPVTGNDIDTDQIIPARYMKVVTFDGLGEYAFNDLRYDSQGNTKPHPFNDARFSGASILVVNRNFGCGSSREHAPQALMRSGIRAIIGESFAEIFAGNCTAMGVPAVTLPHAKVVAIQQAVEKDPSIEITVDLPGSTVTVAGEVHEFDMPAAYRSALIAGSWDSTSVLLSNLDAINARADNIPYIAGFGT